MPFHTNGNVYGMPFLAILGYRKWRCVQTHEFPRVYVNICQNNKQVIQCESIYVAMLVYFKSMSYLTIHSYYTYVITRVKCVAMMLRPNTIRMHNTKLCNRYDRLNATMDVHRTVCHLLG